MHMVAGHAMRAVRRQHSYDPASQWLMGVVIGAFAGASAGSYPPIAYTAVLIATAAFNLLAVSRYYPLTRQQSAVA